MARRRRLEPPSDPAMADIRAAAAGRENERPTAELLGAVPIARVMMDSVAAQRAEIDALRAEAAANRDAAGRLRQIESDGLVIQDVPLDEIDVDYLARDRLPRTCDDEGWRALRMSIQAHGQRIPLDLAPLGPETSRPYGLISGYRRYSVLRRLHEETGEPRFAVARALVRTPATLGQAFLGMVEENEVREGLSYFERGRVCLLAAQQGAFLDPEMALEALFASGSPAKRSKIRSFMLIAGELGDMLRHPEAIGERLGLRLAQALRSGKGGPLRRHLSGCANTISDAAGEQNELVRFLTSAQHTEKKPRTQSARAGEGAFRRVLANGGLVEAIRVRDGVRIIGVQMASDAALEAALDALAADLDERSPV